MRRSDGEHRQRRARNDTLVVNTLAGNDVVNASALQASAIKLAIDGGPGTDVLIQD